MKPEFKSKRPSRCLARLVRLLFLCGLWAIMRLRWFLLHLHPSCVKFYMDEARKEAHFQNVKTGVVHSDYKIIWPNDKILP